MHAELVKDSLCGPHGLPSSPCDEASVGNTGTSKAQGSDTPTTCAWERGHTIMSHKRKLTRRLHHCCSCKTKRKTGLLSLAATKFDNTRDTSEAASGGTRVTKRHTSCSSRSRDVARNNASNASRCCFASPGYCSVSPGNDDECAAAAKEARAWKVVWYSGIEFDAVYKITLCYRKTLGDILLTL